MPQASSVSKWDHRSLMQLMGHVGNLSSKEKVLHHRKHHPWGWYMGMGTLFKWKIYSLIFMRKCYIALNVFHVKNHLGKAHIQQCYLLFQYCSNKVSRTCHLVQHVQYSPTNKHSTQAFPCSHTQPEPASPSFFPKWALVKGKIKPPVGGW